MHLICRKKKESDPLAKWGPTLQGPIPVVGKFVMFFWGWDFAQEETTVRYWRVGRVVKVRPDPDNAVRCKINIVHEYSLYCPPSCGTLSFVLIGRAII